MPADSEPTSPLAEALPNSLDELFNRDPLGLADADIEQIVIALRRQRSTWLTAESNGAKRAPKQAATAKLSLADLGLVKKT